MSRRLFLLIGAALSLIGISAPIIPAAAADSPPAPLGFRVAASNGYTLTVLAVDDPKGERDAVLVFARSPQAAVVYGAPAVVGPGAIAADLGPVGKIDVHFISSGEQRVADLACLRKPATVDSGSYSGVIDFEGEEGYSEAHASTAQGDLSVYCALVASDGPRSEGSGGHSPGARLSALSRGKPHFEFEAMKNSPTRPARFEASISERRGQIGISRVVHTTAGPSAFDFDVPAGFGQVNPPAPFSGAATYLRTPSGRVSWSGDLRVDFPGRSNVRLTGAGSRAGMRRAVLNPGHPFRVL